MNEHHTVGYFADDLKKMRRKNVIQDTCETVKNLHQKLSVKYQRRLIPKL